MTERVAVLGAITIPADRRPGDVRSGATPIPRPGTVPGLWTHQYLWIDGPASVLLVRDDLSLGIMGLRNA